MFRNEEEAKKKQRELKKIEDLEVKKAKRDCEELEKKVATLNQRLERIKNKKLTSNRIAKNRKLLVDSYSNRVGYMNLKSRYSTSVQNNSKNLGLIKLKEIKRRKTQNQLDLINERLLVYRETNRELESVLRESDNFPKMIEIEKRENYYLTQRLQLLIQESK